MLGYVGHFSAGIQGVFEFFTVDPAGHHGRDGGSAGDAQTGVVGHLTRLDDRLYEAFGVRDVADDADGRNAHGRTVGGAITACFFGAVARQNQADGPFGGGPQQVL